MHRHKKYIVFLTVLLNSLYASLGCTLQNKNVNTLAMILSPVDTQPTQKGFFMPPPSPWQLPNHHLKSVPGGRCSFTAEGDAAEWRGDPNYLLAS